MRVKEDTYQQSWFSEDRDISATGLSLYGLIDSGGVEDDDDDD